MNESRISAPPPSGLRGDELLRLKRALRDIAESNRNTTNSRIKLLKKRAREALEEA